MRVRHQPHAEDLVGVRLLLHRGPGQCYCSVQLVEGQLAVVQHHSVPPQLQLQLVEQGQGVGAAGQEWQHRSLWVAVGEVVVVDPLVDVRRGLLLVLRPLVRDTPFRQEVGDGQDQVGLLPVGLAMLQLAPERDGAHAVVRAPFPSSPYPVMNPLCVLFLHGTQGIQAGPHGNECMQGVHRAQRIGMWRPIARSRRRIEDARTGQGSLQPLHLADRSKWSTLVGILVLSEQLPGKVGMPL